MNFKKRKKIDLLLHICFFYVSFLDVLYFSYWDLTANKLKILPKLKNRFFSFQVNESEQVHECRGIKGYLTHSVNILSEGGGRREGA